MVALGGNAILKHGENGTAEEQFEHVKKICKILVDLIREGHKITITHSNGPQVGDILLKNELSKNSLPPMPLDVCGAESQGMIGYTLQQSMYNELKSAGLDIPIVALITQTLVDKNDPAFKNPTKPMGPFYTAMEASKLRKEKGWTTFNDSGRGYRRVVPSPNPTAIVESVSIEELYNHGEIVIACGGGGIPLIINDDNLTFQGVEAVIDKDHSAALFATLICVDILLILTDVDKVALHYDRPNQKELDAITIEDAKKYLAEGYFPADSMGPKVESAIRFVESGGEKAIITSIKSATSSIHGSGGTTIHS